MGSAEIITCRKCKRKCTINRYDLCMECRQIKCATRGCNVVIVMGVGKPYCTRCKNALITRRGKADIE